MGIFTLPQVGYQEVELQSRGEKCLTPEQQVRPLSAHLIPGNSLGTFLLVILFPG